MFNQGNHKGKVNNSGRGIKSLPMHVVESFSFVKGKPHICFFVAYATKDM